MDARDFASLTSAVADATTLDAAVAALLDTLAQRFGFTHSLLYLVDDERDALVAISTRGYDEGVGAEVKVGDGLIGVVARTRLPVRLAGVNVARTYGRSARTEAARAGHAVAREVPLPGIPGALSALAVPVKAQGALFGVLAVESDVFAAFDDRHEAALTVAADVLALALLMLRDNDDVAPSAPATPPPAPGKPRRATYYRSDDSVLIDNEYVVKSLPGRILWKLLREWNDNARTTFTNKELRLDPALKLPAGKDNLESRLILLRRRLEEKFPFVRVTPTGRGRFSFGMDGSVVLEVVDG